MNSDSSEVRSVLRELSKKIAECTEPLRAQAVGNALYGLQNMNSDSSEVRSVLRELSKKIAECSEPLRAQAVGNALYGLQNMNSDSSEVRSVLRELSKKIAECTEPLKGQAVGNALYGIRQLTIDADMIPFVSSCLNLISSCGRDGHFSDICVLYQTLALLDENSNFISSLKAFSLHDKVIEQKQRLLDLLNSHEKKGNYEGIAKSRAEEVFFILATRALGDSYPELSLSSNQFLYGFEVDILLRKQIDNQVCRMLVIEIDGPSHQR